MKKRFLAAVLAATMASTMIMGCSGGGDSTADTSTDSATTDTTETADTADTTADTSASGDKVTLSICWWGNQTRNDVTQKAINLYMEQNPNVEIKAEFTDWSGYWDKLSTMAAGGNLPDIIQQDYSYVAQYQASNQLADLTPYIENGTIDTANIPDSIIESGSIDGKCYALSLGSNAPLMVYDKAIVEEAGVEIPIQPTIDELYEIGQTIYEKTGAKTYFDGGINMAQIIARTQNSQFFGELMEGKTDAAKVHLANVDRFGQAEFSITPDLLVEKNPDVVETKPIIDGTTWNDFSFSNQFISISTTAGRDLGICMYPTTTDAAKQPEYLKPSQFFSIAETSQHKEEAAKFIDWFTNSEECNLILMAERGIPINSVVSAAVKLEVDDVNAQVFDYIAEVTEIAETIDPPSPAGFGEIETLLKSTVENIRYGDITGEAAAESFVPEAQKILQEAAK